MIRSGFVFWQALLFFAGIVVVTCTDGVIVAQVSGRKSREAIGPAFFAALVLAATGWWLLATRVD
jgi:hypothetical protein